MTTVQEIINFVFPEGNYRYYIMYLSSLFVSFFFVIMFILTINYMNTGEVIDTGTFVAQQMFTSTGFLKEPTISIIGWILNAFYYVWVVFAVHTGVSVVLDGVYLAARMRGWIMGQLKW